jgi:flagellar biosynthesis component FlhA
VHAHRAVPISISQLKTKMNAAAVVTYLTSHTFKWCMTLSLYIGSFLVLSHTILYVQFVFEAAVSMRVMIVLMYTMIDKPFTRPTLLLYGLTTEKNYALNVSCKY